MLKATCESIAPSLTNLFNPLSPNIADLQHFDTVLFCDFSLRNAFRPSTELFTLLSSSEAISGRQRENTQFYKVSTNTLTAWLPWWWPHPFLPKAIIILNNHQGIPSRLQNAIIIVVGFSEQYYTLLEHSYQQLYHVE